MNEKPYSVIKRDTQVIYSQHKSWDKAKDSLNDFEQGCYWGLKNEKRLFYISTDFDWLKN